jgi:hypothetical protein
VELPISHFCLPKVKEFQSKLESSIGKLGLQVAKDKNVAKKFNFVEPLIAVISQCSPDEIKNATGKLSDIISDLVHKIGWDHCYAPESLASLDSVVFEKFVNVIKEQILLYQNHKDTYKSILNVVSDAVYNLKEFKAVKNNLLKLSSSVRMFGDQEVRNKIRLKKKQKTVAFLESYNKSEIVTFWLSLPEDNLFLCRGSSKIGYFMKDIASAVSIFEKQGYNDFANILRNSFTSSMFINGTNSDDVRESDPYHGFCRVKMGRVALAIAKLNGYVLNSTVKNNENPTGFSLSAGRNSDYFRQFGYKGINESYPVDKLDGVEVNGSFSISNPSSKFDVFKFVPRAYPFYLFSDLKLPEHVSKVMKWCESCPDIDNKALFDHYWLIVPGPSLQVGSQFVDAGGKSIVVNPNKKITAFNDINQASIYLDRSLVDNNFIYPALLGEKDGKCYFITIWG